MKQRLRREILSTKKRSFCKGFFFLLLLSGIYPFNELFANHLLSNNTHAVETNIPVKGKVTDRSTGQPVAGVSIKVKGSTLGTSSDANGDFSLLVPENATLQISYVGYDPQEIAVNGRTTLTIGIRVSVNSLNEVIVIGYGTQKKVSSTAAVSTIDPTEMAQKPVVNLTNSLVGRASGIIATQGSGEPGFDGSNIQIRGTGSMGRTDPLLIVDGIPRDFSRFDPNTIETFSILKDAAAVAPYGVAGANGVILITTKRGRSGKATLTYNGYAGIQNPTRVEKHTNSYEFSMLHNEADVNEGTAPRIGAYDLQKYKDHSDPDGHPDGDPLTAILGKNRLITYHNLSLSGGNEDYHYFASVGYTHQDGMWSSTYLNRYNGILNLTANATKTTTVNMSVNSYIEDQHFPGASAGGILNLAQRQIPIVPFRYSNGDATVYQGESLAGYLYSSGYSMHENTSLLTQLSIDQKLPIKGLSVKAVISYDNGPDPIFKGNGTTFQRDWNTPIPYSTVDTSQRPYVYNKSKAGPKSPTLTETSSQNHAFTYQGVLTYGGSFGKSAITALAVVEERIVKYSVLKATHANYNLNIDELSFGGPAASDVSVSGHAEGQKQIGYIYRVGYAYDKKYLFEATGRYDGSYLFAPGHRFGFFPAFSAGWRLSEEKFIKQISWINNLKLRASWGQSGAYPASGGNIQTYNYLSSYTVNQNPSAVIGNSTTPGATQGIAETLQGNPQITWEKSNKTDIGFEGTFWSGALSVEADYFYDKRSNMLVNIGGSLPSEYGLGVGLTNGGIMANHGIELTLGSSRSFSNGMRLDVKGTFTYARNKLLKTFEAAGTYDNPNRRRTGRPNGAQFGYQALGYFTAADFNPDGTLKAGIAKYNNLPLHPGDIRYADLSGPNGKPDGKIDANDETFIAGPTTPEIIYGIEPRLNYKGFDLDMLIQGAGNTTLYASNYFVWPFFGVGSATELAYNDHWTPSHTNARYPRITNQPTDNNTKQSSWWLRNTTYMRLKSVELGYTFSDRLLGHSIRSLRVYVAGQNLLTWTPRYKELIDPEGASDNKNYYQQRVFTVGINATF